MRFLFLRVMTVLGLVALLGGCIRHSPEAQAPSSLGGMSAPAANPQVVLTTSQGVIVLELDAAKAPISTENFLKYVDAGHYDGLVFHRVIPNFMVQCGGMDADMRERATLKPIKNEANNGLKNLRGTIAMARTSVVDSATSQFFINLVDNSFLDHGGRDFGYAVFGKVVKGLEVVDAIAKSPTGRKGGHGDVPVTPIVIVSAKRG